MIDRPMRAPTLPAGWTCEDSGQRYTVIRYPDHGFVTIDWKFRGFRGGQAWSGAMSSAKRYTGRGWARQLAADAVEWLEEQMGDHLPTPDLRTGAPCSHEDSAGASWIVAMDITHDGATRAARVCTQCQAYRLVFPARPGAPGPTLSAWYQGVL